MAAQKHIHNKTSQVQAKQNILCPMQPIVSDTIMLESNKHTQYRMQSSIIKSELNESDDEIC